jgi:hypothetical protein
MTCRCACKCRSISFLLLAFLFTGCMQFALEPASQDKRAAMPVATSNAAIKRVATEMLANIRENGFNPDRAINGGMGGLLVNWRYGSHPLQVNINGTGETDADSGSDVRHDPLTDLRYIHNLWSYKVEYPANNYSESEITRYTPIIKREFARAQNERGWLYDTFMDTYALSHDMFYRSTAFSLAQGYARAYHERVGSIFKLNSANPRGTYRVDLTLEAGCALVEAGTQFGSPEWVREGMNTVNFVYDHAYIRQYHTFPSQMGEVMLPDGSANPQQSFYYGQTAQNGRVIGGQVRMGNVSQMVIALLEAYQVTRKQDFLNKATDLLDPFAASNNSLGMWDSVRGGYFYSVRFTGRSPSQPGAMIVDRKRKEAGRQAIMLQAFHLANIVTNNRYRDMEKRMLDVTLKHLYVAAIHGVPYVLNADWSFRRFRNGTVDDMVTTEAMGAALESLFSSRRHC